VNFLDEFSKNNQNSNVIKIRLLGAQLFYVGSQTEGHDEFNSRFSQNCENRFSQNCQKRLKIISHICNADHWEDAGVDGMITLRWIFKK
jgi:hypothetical protein